MQNNKKKSDPGQKKLSLTAKTAYQPREDSLLLQKYVRKFSKGKVLDMGTGSGIQAVTATEKCGVKKVLAADISREAVNYCKKGIKYKNIEFRVSNLFSNVSGKFDTIIFNPPYLPADARLGDLTIEGGKKGFETVQRFLEQAGDYLAENGRILLLISSFTNKARVDELIEENLLQFEELDRKHIFFEDLYVYKLEKSGLLKELNKKGASFIRYFAKGKRGIVYSGEYNGKKAIIKIKHPKSEAVGRMRNEAKWLKVLNKKGIGPKFLFAGREYLVYEFVKGEFILDAFSKMRKQDIKKILISILKQCKKMDGIKITKEEMHRPVKHIIITPSEKPVMIDFERVHKTKKSHNITQFCQFIISGYLLGLLEKKGFGIDKNRIIKLAREYLKKPSEKNFRKIAVELK